MNIYKKGSKKGITVFQPETMKETLELGENLFGWVDLSAAKEEIELSFGEKEYLEIESQVHLDIRLLYLKQLETDKQLIKESN